MTTKRAKPNSQELGPADYETAKKIVDAKRAEDERIASDREYELALPLIGKCFKYRNSYGDAHDSWWLYCRVVAVEKDATSYGAEVTTDQFQDTSIGRIEVIRWHHYATRGKLDAGYIPISKSEFQRRVKPILSKLGLRFVGPNQEVGR